MSIQNQSVEKYIKSFPEPIQERLLKIRALILNLTTEATEEFSYAMPAYKYNKKPLVYFAAFKEHIGIYATPQTHERFKEELATYKQGKGSVQFPHEKEIPYQLLKEMVSYKLEELKKAKPKLKKK